MTEYYDGFPIVDAEFEEIVEIGGKQYIVEKPVSLKQRMIFSVNVLCLVLIVFEAIEIVRLL